MAAAVGVDAHELANAAGRGLRAPGQPALQRPRRGPRGAREQTSGADRVGVVGPGSGVTLREPDGSERRPDGYDQLRG